MGVTRTNRAVARATGASCPNWEVIEISLYLVEVSRDATGGRP
jgi:hypothetical protein